MELRRLGLVGGIAALVAVGLGWWMTPDRGSEVVARSTVDVAQRGAGAGEVERDRDRDRDPDADRDLDRDLDRGVPELEERRAERMPTYAIDPSEVLSPDQQGITTATLQRRDRFLACWENERPPDATRLTLKFTFTDAGEGAGAVDVDIPAMPHASALRACLNDALSDARFVSPGDVAQTVMWPMPLPSE